MKKNREYLVPLSRQTVDLLCRRCGLCTGEGLVFPGTKIGKRLSENTLIYACYRMGYRGRQTVHGFRAAIGRNAAEAVGVRRLAASLRTGHDRWRTAGRLCRGQFTVHAAGAALRPSRVVPPGGSIHRARAPAGRGGLSAGAGRGGRQASFAGALQGLDRQDPPSCWASPIPPPCRWSN
jgi:hypothetical protein